MTPPPSKIILDTDPGVDDVLAVLLALASPEIDLALITIVFGNIHAPIAHANLLKVYYNLALELKAVPGAAARYTRLAAPTKTVLALGEDGPIGGEKHVATYFHGPDGLSNISQTNPEYTPPPMDPSQPHEYLDISPVPAPQAMLDLLRTEPEGTVTIVALGPLTNVAHAYRLDPTTFSRAAEVVWMGGALDVPGNTSPVAEFNCYADPYALDMIIAATKRGEFRFTFAPLDITTPHMIPFSELIHPSFVEGYVADPAAAPIQPPTPLQAFTSAFLLRVRGLQASFGNPDAMEMHDPVAVWYAIDNAARGRSNGNVLAPQWGVTPREFAVERIGEITRGLCVVDRRGGSGEHTGNRTEDETLLTGDVPPAVVPNVPHPTQLPYVITATPGSDVLQRALLSRVYGISA